ncbi:hypothetical protein QJS04_geneDACA012868 [Acorus gramineus]|uniref:VQ domain-containing protein n=1 Tax=Acorus gramineus TaxID=55184 RepID=A0AAV9BEN9_ACOGR|nr:hypothetical protein QJS04_geneDACA012868 [Acorus gramineus]
MDHLRRPPQENPQSQTTQSTPTSTSSSNGGSKTPNTNSTTNPPRFESNPYPTTFIQADTSSFKQVVQMLTGSSESIKHSKPSDQPPKNPIPTGPKKPSFKLYERRNSLKNGFKLSPLVPGASGPVGSFSPRKCQPPEILSPSILDFPSLVLSPVTPLVSDPFNRSPPLTGGTPTATIAAAQLAEERAIAEKGYYLHPSPRGSEPPPRLLPLFPVTSPRAAAATSSLD